MSSTNRVLAGPPGDACFNRGVQHTGTPAGTTDSDLVQDYFAEGGFHVLGIDYFDGDPVHKHTEADFDRSAWIANAKKRAGEWVLKWFKAVKEFYGSDAKYCVVGYCFGGPHALGFANSDEFVAGEVVFGVYMRWKFDLGSKFLIHCASSILAAFAHPAFLNEDHFRTIKKPLFLSCAETDHTFPLESRRRAEDILVEVKAKYYIQVFSGVKHGFAVRGDPEVEDERWAKEESVRYILVWFNQFTEEAAKAK
ncbi:hypothetical protein D9758_016755 [Tetrapyrgos nigripes]|uniref:Dienelactone hydrolase domain-containing protein n=1 Tax=Tetrapyrgos nigripes TaxID=182062 RepID=A0A8H5FKI2_9AGAR|nr:hypothetical protein D9758_016755 [Tetrapyrgos nigripes]